MPKSVFDMPMSQSRYECQQLKKKVKLPYTVEVIGGGAELARWKADKAKADAEYAHAKRERAIAAFTSGETHPEVAQIEKAIRDRKEKEAFDREAAERRRLALLMAQYEAAAPAASEPSTGLWAKVKGLISKVWQSANFSK